MLFCKTGGFFLRHTGCYTVLNLASPRVISTFAKDLSEATTFGE
jgi:hypothetical protein